MTTYQVAGGLLSLIVVFGLLNQRFLKLPETIGITTAGLLTAPVQIGSVVEIIFIDLDTLSIEQHGVPNRGRGGIAEPERAEVELRLANAMHQLDA